MPFEYRGLKNQYPGSEKANTHKRPFRFEAFTTYLLVLSRVRIMAALQP